MKSRETTRPRIAAAAAVALLLAGCGSAGATLQPSAPRDVKATAGPIGTTPRGLGLAVGAQAPDAEVQTADGKAMRLTAALGTGKALLLFYRGGWCPFCNFQLREWTAGWPELQRRGVTVVAVSVDAPEGARATQMALKSPFSLLADPDLSAHSAFRVTIEESASKVAMMKLMGLDVERWSGRDHHKMAAPAIFYLEAGKVRWRHVDVDYKTRPSLQQVLGAVDAL